MIYEIGLKTTNHSYNVYSNLIAISLTHTGKWVYITLKEGSTKDLRSGMTFTSFQFLFLTTLRVYVDWWGNHNIS